jgi:hypothetical protein
VDAHVSTAWFFLWCLMFASFDNILWSLYSGQDTCNLGGSQPMLPAVKPFVGQMDLRWIQAI